MDWCDRETQTINSHIGGVTRQGKSGISVGYGEGRSGAEEARASGPLCFDLHLVTSDAHRVTMPGLSEIDPKKVWRLERWLPVLPALCPPSFPQTGSMFGRIVGEAMNALQETGDELQSEWTATPPLPTYGHF
jgi:hypothetical protein